MKRIMRLLVVCSAAAGLLLSLSSSAGAAKMYWTDQSTKNIQRADLDGSNVEELLTGLSLPQFIALDVAGGKMYWADPGPKIKRANLDGSNVQDIVAGLSFPIGIALDVAGGKVYWTDPGKFPGIQIQRANLDGSNVEDLVGGLQTALGIDLDVTAGKMYWTDNGSPGNIQRRNLDGTGPIDTLVTGLGVGNTFGIALDVAAGKMYWAVTGKIQRANLSGSTIQNLVTGLAAPKDIALDVAGGKMYWTDSGTGKIQRADLDGSNVVDLVTGLAAPIGIALDLSPEIVKEITSGPDVDLDGNIDVVVEVKQTTTTVPPYDFDITYFNPGGPPVLIVDTVPAEWVVTAINDDVANLPVAPGGLANFSDGFGSVDVFRTGKGAKSKSSTKIHWTPPTDGATINVEAETRQSPSGKVKFAPTSCGPLFLNSGPAEVFEVDEDGEPLDQPPLFESNVLCLAAVKDLDAVAGVVPDGSGDEDEDGLTDFEEACTIGTDPCDFDTDGDTFEDGVDNCPLVFNDPQTDADGDGVGAACDPDDDDPDVP